ncbi:epimerase [candidate division KSB1 bacterium]|nr:epimerase [candidate division KSB1 bacterium]
MNQPFPLTIDSESVLDELLSRPSNALIEDLKMFDGDFIVLGAGGKMGPTLTWMLKRALDAAESSSRIYAVSRFSSSGSREWMESKGISTIAADLLKRSEVERLPACPYVIYMAGMKFGATQQPSLTWAMNTYVPALIAEKYAGARIVALSTGTVYSFVPVESGGSRESDVPVPVGEYAQSCLGRERMFDHFSRQDHTRIALIRLNYAVEMRYGVLVDIGLKVLHEQPVDLTMGYLNLIWQGDANDMILRCLNLCQSPATPVNITGPDILSVRELACEFARRMNKTPVFTGKEAPTALLNNASLALQQFGPPKIDLERLLDWTSDWLQKNKPLLDKPTHFETRNGNF